MRPVGSVRKILALEAKAGMLGVLSPGDARRCDVQRAGARLGHVHLQDSDGYADRHWQLGQGTILWPSVFDAIRETGATPRLIIELRDKAGVIPSARHLAALGLAE